MFLYFVFIKLYVTAILNFTTSLKSDDGIYIILIL